MVNKLTVLGQRKDRDRQGVGTGRKAGDSAE